MLSTAINRTLIAGLAFHTAKPNDGGAPDYSSSSLPAAEAAAGHQTRPLLVIRTLNQGLQQEPLSDAVFANLSDLHTFMQRNRHVQTNQDINNYNIVAPDTEPIHWCRYAAAAYLGFQDFLLSVGAEDDRTINAGGALNNHQNPHDDNNHHLELPKGISLLISSNIPMGAGLSSSSAVVVGCVKLLSMLKNIHLSPSTLANISIKAEKYTGTAGGGMDQATMCLSSRTAASARLIGFNPLRSFPAPLPGPMHLLVVDSQVRCLKGIDTHKRFNLRALECKLGLADLIRKGFVLSGRLEEIATLTLRNALEDPLHPRSFNEMMDLVNDHVDELKTRDQVIAELGGEKSNALRGLLDVVGRDALYKNETFKPRTRTVHVYSEAQRVREFYQMCKYFQNISEGRTGDSRVALEVRETKDLQITEIVQETNEGDNQMMDFVEFPCPERHTLQQTKNYILIRLGNLLIESQVSCNVFYDCSCEELNHLISCGSQAGALGARLTGAGWGGCALVAGTENKLPRIKARLRNALRSSDISQKIPPRPFDELLFSAEPFGCLKAFVVMPKTLDREGVEAA